MTDAPSLVPNAGPRDDVSPSPKHQQTSADSHFAPSSLLSHMHTAPFQSAHDVTQEVLKSASGDVSNTPDATAPRLPPNSATGPTAQDPPADGQGPKQNAGDAQPAPKFKIKRTGTSKLPPGHWAPTTPATQDTDTVPAGADQDKDAAAAARVEQVKRLSGATHRIPDKAIDSWAGGSPSRSSSASSTAALSRSTSAGGSATQVVDMVQMAKMAHREQIAKAASPQSIAMKRKWASGAMDHVPEKAAKTRRLKAERLNAERLNAERGTSVISISDGSASGSPPAGSSTPVPAPAGAKKPSLAQHYRGRAGGWAATTPSDESLPSAVVSDVMSSQSDTPKRVTNAVTDEKIAWRPVILPPKKSAKKASGQSEPSSPHVPGTPFARSLSGRPYDMVPNEGGRYVHGFGALFPDGYAPFPDPDGKGPRWTCPVQHCTHERTYLKSHGKHFVNDHKACLLNDNRDGTFTVVGYDMKQNAPVVVSQDAKTGTATKPTPGAAAVTEDEQGVSDAVGSSPATNDTAGKHQGGEIAPTGAPFSSTPSGRPYTTYPNNGGRTFGVLIPDGYERLVTSEEKPWVCPIVPCLSSWSTQNGLSIHFARIHGGWMLNDNLDGTLSALRRRDDDDRFRSVQGWAPKDALVVSQGPMASVDEPLASTKTINSVKKNGGPPVSTPDQPTPSSAQPTFLSPLLLKNNYLAPASNVRPAEGLDAGARELWNYIRPHLTEFTECPDSSWIPEMLKLPKVRDIVWDDAYIAAKGFRDKVSRDVATLVIQVTGEVTPKTCSRCRDGKKGPYGECIVISDRAPLDARLIFTSCASCIYNGQGTYCTAKFRGKKRAVEDQTAAERGHAADADEPSTSVLGLQVPESNHDHAPIRRSERVQVKEATALRASYESPVPAKRAGEDGPFVPDEEDPAPPVSSPPPPPPPPPPHPRTRALARCSDEQADLHPANTDSMEIQDWELAPGRLLSAAPAAADGELPADIAFSRPYLTAANQAVAVAPDVTLRVDVVASGSSLRFAPSADRVRLCAVGAGKVRVRMQGEAEFAIGPHGVFRVLRGRSCVVLNRLYGDAVLHVTEVPDYS